MSQFSETIMHQKYSHQIRGRPETWAEIAHRVTRSVMGAVDVPEKIVGEIETAIREKKFMPGGRYLYASGRPFHQTQNCYAGETEVVTRLGTRDLRSLAGTTTAIMTTGGMWVNAPVRSFGEQELMRVTLTRAGAEKTIWATPEHSWRVTKNLNGRPAGKQVVETKALRKGQLLWSVYGYGIARTPIGLAGVQHGIVFGDGCLPKDDWGFNTASVRLCGDKDRQLLPYFDGYRTREIELDLEVVGLPRHYKTPVSLQSDRSYLLGWLAGYMAADGCVSTEGAITISGTKKENLQLVKDVCYLLGIGAYGIRSVDRISNLTDEPSSRLYSVALMRHTLEAKFFLIEQHRRNFEANPPKRGECGWKVVKVESTTRVEEVFCAVVEETHEFVLADNILTGNCLLMKAEDSREGWATLMHNATMALMTGAGIGIDYSDIRSEGAAIKKTGGFATGPLALMEMINRSGNGIMQGGSRRCLPGDTLITMADLSKQAIAQLRVGDKVHTRFGPREVLAAVEQSPRPLVEISTDRGRLVSSLNHRWLCATRARTKTFTVDAAGLSLGHKVYALPTPVPGGKEFNTARAYLLGYFLGDGCAYRSGRSAEVTLQVAKPAHNQKQVAYLTQALSAAAGHECVVRRGHGEVTEIRCQSAAAVSLFQKFKLPHLSFRIPAEIREASLAARWAFAAGWFDADGYYGNDSWKVSNKHASTRAELQAFLLESLGIYSTECGTEIRLCSYQFPTWRRGIGPYAFKKPRGRLYIRATGEIPTAITGIRLLPPEKTFDLQIEGAEEFVADGFVSHNSAIWAGLNWQHPDCLKFIEMKNWRPEVRSLKEKDYNFPAVMDGTNISVLLDDAFFRAYENEASQKHTLAHSIYWATIRQMLKTAEPGFSVDVGDNSGETLRNACCSGETEVLTPKGYQRIDSLIEEPVEIWNGFEWSMVQPKVTGHDRDMVTVNLSDGRQLTCTKNHSFWIAADYNGGKDMVMADNLEAGMKLIKAQFPVIEEGKDVGYAYIQGFISGDGLDGYHHMKLYGEKVECAGRMVGRLRKYNEKAGFFLDLDAHPKVFVPHDWSLRSRLDWFAGLLDSDGTELREGGSQIASVDRRFLMNVQKMLTTLGVNSKVTPGNTAGPRSLPDGKGGYRDYTCQDAYRLLVGAVQMQHLKGLGLKCERLSFDKAPTRDATQFVVVISVEEAGICDTVYCFNEPKRHLGCFDGVVTGQCTEVTSRDDSDICNLGSINMANIDSLEEMRFMVKLGVIFLMAGTVYSDVPYGKVAEIRTKNRRLGLGLMGLHEWLLKKGKRYEPDDELGEYLSIYKKSGQYAAKSAEKLGLSNPVKTRAIAPTGTIGIVAETSTGIEPIFCVALKRRYLKGNVTHFQYIVDPTAKRLIDQGVDPDKIEDAYTLADDVEKRVAFQAWVQSYVDHGISSTINLPAWGSELNNDSRVRPFGEMLLKYLPKLRGITCYPDGARGGQPLTPVKYSTAERHIGEVFIEQQDVCEITKAGSCG